MEIEKFGVELETFFDEASYIKTLNKFKDAKEEIQKNTKIDLGVSKLTNDEASKIVGVFKKVANAGKEVFIKVKESVMNVFNSTKSIMSAIKIGILGIGKALFGIGIIKFIGLIGSGIMTFIHYNDTIKGIGDSINTLKAEFMSLSYTIGSIFSGVLQWIVDLLRTVVNWLAKAIAYINVFLTALGFGGKSAEYFRKKMGESAGAIGGASKAQKEMNKQLAGFDELNNLSEDKDSSGGGGGGSGSGAGIPSFADLELDEDLIKAIQDFGAKFRIAFDDVIFNWDNLNEESIRAKVVAGLTAITGGLIGWSLGGPLGAVVGSIAGGLLGIGIDALIFNFDGAASGKEKILSNLVSAMSLGTGIGFFIGGPGGALVGASLGAVISVAFSWATIDSSDFTRGMQEIMVGINNWIIDNLPGIAKIFGMTPLDINMERFKEPKGVGDLEHNRQVLREEGYSEEEIQAFLDSDPNTARRTTVGGHGMQESYDKRREVPKTGVQEIVEDSKKAFKDLDGVYSNGMKNLDKITKKGNNTISKTFSDTNKSIVKDTKKGSGDSVKEVENNFSPLEKLMETLVKIPVDNNLKGAFKNSNKYASDGYKNTTNPFASTNSWFSTNVTSKVSGLFSSLFGTGSGSVGSSANTGMSNLKSPFNSGSTGAVATFKTITSGIIGKFKETFENTGVGTIAEKAKKGFDNLKSAFSNVGAWFDQNVRNPANTSIAGIQSSKTIDVRLNKTDFGVNVYQSEPTKIQVSVPKIKFHYVPQFSEYEAQMGGRVILATGTNYVPADMPAYIHKGEAVIPKKFNDQKFFGTGNEETNELLERLINVVESKEFRTYISQSEIGQASVNYIRQQSRVMGGSII